MSIALGIAPASPGDGGGSSDEGEPAEVTAEAWFTAPATDALPPTFTEEVPPGVVCILIPEACPGEVQEATAPLGETLRETDAPQSPVQPVVPGTLPVGQLGGEDRYTSYLRFELPDVPPDAMVQSFELVLHEDGVNYAAESPAFREAVTAFVAQAADEPSPEPFINFLSGVAEGDHGLLGVEPTGIQACPVTESWETGGNQDAAEQPGRNCIFGATGERHDDGTWRFDLSFAAQEWLGGDLTNEGLYLGPLTAPTLDYGDPDPSTNFQISFAGADADPEDQPKIAYSFTEASDTLGGTARDDTSVEGDRTAAQRGQEPAEPTARAADPRVGDTGPAQPQPQQPEQREEAMEPSALTGDPSIPPRMWIAAALGLAGVALFARAALAGTAGAGLGSGALTRLVGKEGEGG